MLAGALDDAAIALVTEARGNNKLANLAPCANCDHGRPGLRADVHQVVRGEGVPPAVDRRRGQRADDPLHRGATGGTYNDGIDLGDARPAAVGGFLYVTQLGSGSGAPVTLTNDELASNLSFLVGGSPPDQTLLDAAAGGNLGNADGRETQVRRLLGTTPGKNRMVRVVREWLGTDAIAETGKDATASSAYSGAKNVDRRREQQLRRRGAAELDGHGQRAPERELERHRQLAREPTDRCDLGRGPTSTRCCRTASAS